MACLPTILRLQLFPAGTGHCQCRGSACRKVGVPMLGKSLCMCIAVKVEHLFPALFLLLAGCTKLKLSWRAFCAAAYLPESICVPIVHHVKAAIHVYPDGPAACSREQEIQHQQHSAAVALDHSGTGQCNGGGYTGMHGPVHALWASCKVFWHTACTSWPYRA